MSEERGRAETLSSASALTPFPFLFAFSFSRTLLLQDQPGSYLQVRILPLPVVPCLNPSLTARSADLPAALQARHRKHARRQLPRNPYHHLPPILLHPRKQAEGSAASRSRRRRSRRRGKHRPQGRQAHQQPDRLRRPYRLRKPQVSSLFCTGSNR